VNYPTWFFCIVFTLLNALGFGQDFSRDLELKSPRMSGDDVVKVQKQLLDLGFSEIGAADGYFGPMTKNAVVSFQRHFGLSDTGAVNKTAWTILFSNVVTPVVLQQIQAEPKLERSGLKKAGEDIEGESSEGGHVDRFFSSGKPLYEDYEFDGEMGKVQYAVLHTPNGLTILEKDYSYPEPFDIEHAKVTNIAYYRLAKALYKISEGRIESAKEDDLPVLRYVK
jgi:peptidoglycan hydrolase-like protein with peptidoglycan-binding domain